jgi:hypothetical protein
VLISFKQPAANLMVGSFRFRGENKTFLLLALKFGQLVAINGPVEAPVVSRGMIVRPQQRPQYRRQNTSGQESENDPKKHVCYLFGTGVENNRSALAGKRPGVAVWKPLVANRW